MGRGEFVCLIGASGCGKSTLLSLVAGPGLGHRRARWPSAGRVAMMFQEPGLLPWLTAGSQRRARPAGQEAFPGRTGGAATDELLKLVRLDGFGAKRPHELSGGMRQRVALARALAQDADVLLMDEPFGALDAMTRDLLHDELERICAEQTLTVLFVTHNVREAVRLGDRVIVLSSRPGRVIDEYPVPADGPRGINTAQNASSGQHHHRTAARGDGAAWQLTRRCTGWTSWSLQSEQARGRRPAGSAAGSGRRRGRSCWRSPWCWRSGSW